MPDPNCQSAAIDSPRAEYRRGDYARSQQVRRILRLALVLRDHAATIEEMARAMRVTTRTVRRDLAVLRSLPLPLARLDDGRWKVTGLSPLTDGRR